MNLGMWRIVLTLSVAVLEQELQSLFNIAHYHNVIILMITFLGLVNLNLVALFNSTINTKSQCI